MGLAIEPTGGCEPPPALELGAHAAHMAAGPVESSAGRAGAERLRKGTRAYRDARQLVRGGFAQGDVVDEAAREGRMRPVDVRPACQGERLGRFIVVDQADDLEVARQREGRPLRVTVLFLGIAR